ncbi:Fe-S cluster assembly ATPase SufC [Geminicoccaceae bacterium 1502E]|nr:Fe-S cluster assembly ATPase SufC [Geminicoccaceae bacterium 1502E]
MLKIDNLHVSVDGKDILKGLSLEVKPGEVHAIMGPNGSGKSTLAYVLAGRDGYEVTEGSVSLGEEDLLELDPEERAAAGVFLAMQYPVEIPGVANMYFLRQALNAVRRARGEEEVSAADFMRRIKEAARVVGVRDDLLKRDLNAGFSGGEKKRNEILQMAMLEPRLAVLDETDSGLDIDALRTVAEGVNKLRSPDRAIVVITHYQRLLDYIVPDKVHVLAQGKIQRSGDRSLALELEEKGYDGVLGDKAAA